VTFSMAMSSVAVQVMFSQPMVTSRGADFLICVLEITGGVVSELVCASSYAPMSAVVPWGLVMPRMSFVAAVLVDPELIAGEVL